MNEITDKFDNFVRSKIHYFENKIIEESEETLAADFISLIKELNGNNNESISERNK